MLKNERHQFIINEINQHKKVFSSELAQQLGVSADTVIRDLNELAQSGKLSKVYGGALAKPFLCSADLQAGYPAEARMAVTRKAAGFIKNGMSIVMEGGNTLCNIAEYIPEDIRATILTINPLTALKMASHRGIQVILVGGQVCKNSGITIGSHTAHYLSDVKTDLCLLAANGISADTGLTDSDIEVAFIKKSMIKAAAKLVVVATSDNLNSDQYIKVCETNQIHTLITELDPLSPELAAYHRTGIQVL